jgi:hypothetical protein
MAGGGSEQRPASMAPGLQKVRDPCHRDGGPETACHDAGRHSHHGGPAAELTRETQPPPARPQALVCRRPEKPATQQHCRWEHCRWEHCRWEHCLEQHCLEQHCQQEPRQLPQPLLLMVLLLMVLQRLACCPRAHGATTPAAGQRPPAESRSRCVVLAGHRHPQQPLPLPEFPQHRVRRWGVAMLQGQTTPPHLWCSQGRPSRQ